MIKIVGHLRSEGFADNLAYVSESRCDGVELFRIIFDSFGKIGRLLSMIGITLLFLVYKMRVNACRAAIALTNEISYAGRYEVNEYQTTHLLRIAIIGIKMYAVKSKPMFLGITRFEVIWADVLEDFLYVSKSILNKVRCFVGHHSDEIALDTIDFDSFTDSRQSHLTGQKDEVTYSFLIDWGTLI
jgi:hypothetical protein